MEAHHVTQQAKGLKGCPGVRMNLGGRHVERPKHAHCERVKKQRHAQVRKIAGIHIKERGTVARSPHAYSLSRPARHNVEITEQAARL